MADYLFGNIFLFCSFGFFTQLVLSSSLKHNFTNILTIVMELHCSALVNGGNILTAEHKERKKKKNRTWTSEWTHIRPRCLSGSSWSSARPVPHSRRWVLPGRSTGPPTHAPDGSCSSSGPPCTTRGKQTPL